MEVHGFFVEQKFILTVPRAWLLIHTLWHILNKFQSQKQPSGAYFTNMDRLQSQHGYVSSKLACTMRHFVFYLCSKYCVPAPNQILCLCWVPGVFSTCLTVLYMCIIWDHKCTYWVYVSLLWIYLVMEHAMKRFQISTPWTRKCPEHTLAPIFWVIRYPIKSVTKLLIQSQLGNGLAILPYA